MPMLLTELPLCWAADRQRPARGLHPKVFEGAGTVATPTLTVNAAMFEFGWRSAYSRKSASSRSPCRTASARSQPGRISAQQAWAECTALAPGTSQSWHNRPTSANNSSAAASRARTHRSDRFRPAPGSRGPLLPAIGKCRVELLNQLAVQGAGRHPRQGSAGRSDGRR